MTQFKAIFPNTLTSLNLLSGVLGIIFCFESNLLAASICIGAAALFDFLDGFAARLLKVSGELGKQLDSLADMVTFGVLPGIMMFQYISASMGLYFIPLSEYSTTELLLSGSGLLLTIFSSVRLAKFNIDTRQSNGFIGVPTPAMAIFIGSFPLIIQYQLNLNMYVPPSPEQFPNIAKLLFLDPFDKAIVNLYFSTHFLVGISVLFSFLMNIEVPLLALKFKNFKFKPNREKYFFIICVVLLLIISTGAYWFPFPIYSLEFVVLPTIITFYIAYSIFINLIKKKTNEVQS